MNVVTAEDTLSAVWGDTRNGTLNIWFQRTGLRNPNPSGIRPIATETPPWVRYGPNPAHERFWAEAPGLACINLYDLKGDLLKTASAGVKADDSLRSAILQLSGLPPGEYMLEAVTARGNLVQKIMIK